MAGREIRDWLEEVEGDLAFEPAPGFEPTTSDFEWKVANQLHQELKLVG